MKKRGKWLLLIIFTTLFAFACTVNRVEPKVGVTPEDEKAAIKSELAAIFAKKALEKGKFDIKTRYILAYIFKVDEKQCEICFAETREMFKALNQSKVVEQGDLSLFLSTDATAAEAIDFLTEIFYELQIDTGEFLAKVNFAIFVNQKKNFSTFEINNFILPAVLIAEITIFDGAKEIYRKEGKPVPWRDIDQIILRGSELM